MKLILRRGTVEDADAMAAIEAVCFTDPWSADSFRQMTALTAARSLAACIEVNGEQKLVGYFMALAVPPEAEIANLAVAPDYRGCGIGRALMEEGLGSLRREGCDSFFLEVRASNLPAQTLYRRLGFAETGRRRRYYQNPVEDALLMALFDS